jgi:hypothetical protein
MPDAKSRGDFRDECINCGLRDAGSLQVCADQGSDPLADESIDMRGRSHAGSGESGDASEADQHRPSIGALHSVSISNGFRPDLRRTAGQQREAIGQPQSGLD